MNPSNPNGANQWVLDPRQRLCWDYYIDPDSPTFSNAYQSALKAGYEENTCLSITVQPWFKEKCGRHELFEQAEKNLSTVLNLPIEDEKLGDRVLKATLFVSERLGKDKGYSTRQEVTGKDGKDLMTTLTEEQQEKLNSLL